MCGRGAGSTLSGHDLQFLTSSPVTNPMAFSKQAAADVEAAGRAQPMRRGCARC